MVRGFLTVAFALLAVAACGSPAAQLGAESGNPFSPPGVSGPGGGTAPSDGDGLCVLPLPDGGCPDTPVGPPLPADN